MHNPYVQDPATGRSLTRTYLEAWFQQLNGPVSQNVERVNEKTGEVQTVKVTHPSILAEIYATTLRPQDVLYTFPPRNPLKTYIGRASKATSGHNTGETLWCIKADISSACQQLTKPWRLTLGLRYIRDWSDQQIADYIGTDRWTVSRAISNALDKLTSILDHK